MDKIFADPASALAGVHDGATVLIGGFGGAGYPFELVQCLAGMEVKDLTLISNNAGHASSAFLQMIRERRVARIVCSFPVRNEPNLERALGAHELVLEVVPQGTLAERIRAAGAGIPAFYTRTGVGTELAAGREAREIGGKIYLLEEAIEADVALVKATEGDRWGNLTFRAASQNFNPVMAMAAKLTVAQVDRVVELGGLPPSLIHTPGIFVDRVVHVEKVAAAREAS